MEEQLSPLSWGFIHDEEGMQDLKHTLLFTTLELEKTLISAKQEISKRELELIHLKDVVSKTMKERDEAQRGWRKLMLEKFLLELEQQQETTSLSGVSSSDNESKFDLKLAANKPLPEKGRLLQAVKDAGPLLQNLLLAGPLPQWQRPPPQLASVEIPPVPISSPRQQESFNHCLSKKRRGTKTSNLLLTPCTTRSNYDSSPSTIL